MKKEDLANLVEKLEESLIALGMTEHEDTRIMPIYSEYWVANELMKIGHNVEVLNRRSFDLLIPEKNIRIDVKSGKFGGLNAGASFGKGSQIKESKFDYCVFTTYDVDLQIKEAMVFTREELKDVADKPRPQLAAHPTSNYCLLLRYESLEAYKQDVEKEDRLNTEMQLHEHPEKFVNRWDKIK